MIISNTPSPIFLHGTLIFSYIICQKKLNNDNGAGIFSINLKSYHNHIPTKSSYISQLDPPKPENYNKPDTSKIKLV